MQSACQCLVGIGKALDCQQMGHWWLAGIDVFRNVTKAAAVIPA